ncbi:MAG TPA: hypothetical protein VIJ22_19470 [Polyangiaceae bacterium]
MATRRRIRRLLITALAVGGLLLMLAGIFYAGVVVQVEATSPGRISTVEVMLAPGLILAGSAVFYLLLRGPVDGRPEDEPPTPEPGAPSASPTSPPRRKLSRLDGLLEARDFLPDEMPEGWTRPLAMRRSRGWTFDTKTERVALELSPKKWMSTVKVLVAGLGTREPVSDARCAEILAQVKLVGEFIETDPGKEHPEKRMWISIPNGVRPRWSVPRSIPPVRERVLSPHLVAARKYLPQKLPLGWSVPVAIGDDHGTDWKDGAWMIATGDDRFMIVCLVTSKGRVKLSVTFFGADAIEVSEGDAADMLRHFRGVLEFAQTEEVPAAVPTRTYLGEIAPDGGPRVLLN